MNIPTRYFGDISSRNIILIVGGSGDSKDSYTDFVTALSSTLINHKIITFSFQGQEDNRDLPLSLQLHDLSLVMSEINKDNPESLTIIATSMGAFSTAHIISSAPFDRLVSNVILLDPADYYVDTTETVGDSYTWTGLQTCSPLRQTTATLMRNINSAMKVHVVNFTIRNYSSAGYAPQDLRGKDNAGMYSRLNNEMVHAFYINTPDKNRGKYIEDNTLPHAFIRDGDRKKNIKTLIKIIHQCLDR